MPQQNSPKPRPTAKLDSTLDRHLTAYVTVATAAGVSVLAATPAAASIVYTPADVAIGRSYALDVNNDGIADFTFDIFTISQSAGFIADLNVHLDVPGNAVRADRVGGGEAAAMPIGAAIGPAKPFTSFLSTYSGVFMYAHGEFNGSGGVSGFWDGPWANQTNKFVGLKFMIAGSVHYGWARLSTATGNVLTGYAYETEPNQHIRAGQIGGTDAQPEFVAPMALGKLAKGVEVRK
jgi:hypothetical protein